MGIGIDGISLADGVPDTLTMVEAIMIIPDKTLVNKTRL
jgi:hypothetical protein